MTAGSVNCTSRYVLVLESALAPPGAAVVRDGDVLSVACADGGPRAGVDLLGLARRALAEAGCGAPDVAAVACGRGPGSFSGLRVALGLARGFALGRPGLLFGGADSLVLLAAAAGEPLPAWVALPWGRLRVLVGRAGPQGAEPGAVLVPRADLARRPEGRGQRVVVHPALADDPLPAGATRVVAGVPPVLALARLVTGGALRLQAGAPPGPSYVVPPDAVLPGRTHVLPDGYAVAELREDELPALAALVAEGFENPWSEAMLADEGRRGAFLPVVRGPGGGVAAAAVARVEPDALSVFIVVVDPAHRGRGLGRALVRDLVARGKDAGAERADLEVRAGNAPAIALYASEGFVPVGLRRRYYRDGSDALLMSATLRRPPSPSVS